MIEENILTKDQISLDFEMDIHKELGCVVFDEVHYINDHDRGKVWEETILLIPQHTILVMLSATIDKAEKFAEWIEKKKERDVWLASTEERVVPLTHYTYLTLPKSQINLHSKNISITTTPLVLRKHHEPWQSATFKKIETLSKYFYQNRIYVKRPFVLNEIVKYLHTHNLLPAICFVFSRKKVEEYAQYISLYLNSKFQKQRVDERCKQILMNKLSNYKEYLNLPEFVSILKILQKGIGIHHAGILPVFKEMIEILFGEGYIKLLFATETFAVGINMPTKTVIFTSLQKFDGNKFRYLLPHEYTQMAGRAGRRGIDKKGLVIHLNNLFDLPSQHEYEKILCGKPQQLESKFQINCNLILRLLSIQEQNFSAFINNSMLHDSLIKEEQQMNSLIQNIKEKLEKKRNLLQYCQTPIPILKQYQTLHERLKLSSKKTTKKILKNMKLIESEHKHLKKEINQIIHINNIEIELENAQDNLSSIKEYINRTVNLIIEILEYYKFVERDKDVLKLTETGEIAANIQEIHCLVFAELLYNQEFNHFTPQELVCILSCFANISIPREERMPNIISKKIPNAVKSMITKIQQKYNEFQEIEIQYYLNSGQNYELQFELCDIIYDWCNAENIDDCKYIFQQLENKNIFLGEFIKAILKINNIANELEKICSIQSNLELLKTIKNIPSLTLKSIATNQSLYL